MRALHQPVLPQSLLVLTSELFCLSGAAFGLEPPTSPVASEGRGQSCAELNILSPLLELCGTRLCGSERAALPCSATEASCLFDIPALAPSSFLTSPCLLCRTQRCHGNRLLFKGNILSYILWRCWSCFFWISRGCTSMTIG